MNLDLSLLKFFWKLKELNIVLYPQIKKARTK
jgi:hypothetical protein